MVSVLLCSVCKQTKDISNFYRKPKKHGTCRACIIKRNYAWRVHNKERRNKSERERLRAIRIEVLTHYAHGDLKCACCGVREHQFLALDHTYNDGAQKRREAKSSGVIYMIKLRKKGYPGGYQVLCHNCNCAKGFYGTCPHMKVAA